MKTVKPGITKPKGFVANGLHCGIKRSKKPDLALIASHKSAVGAAVFTKNSIKAAPVLVSQRHVRKGNIRAFVVNSGNANCFTGSFGMIYAKKTAELVGKHLNVPANEVIVASTGIIGKPLPFNKIEESVPELVKGLSVTASKRVAFAILTTDQTIKEVSVQLKIGNKTVTVSGCAKGSGMVAPNMATMLGFITTDCAISRALLKKALKTATDASFNCITIDGCMSTNDMVAVMANGEAKNPKITKPGKDYTKFTEALKFICLGLAKKIVEDGEGATKFVTINVKNAKTEKQAREVGLAVANSVLVKTAVFGSNPNWGRVAAAVGSLGIAKITEDNLKIDFSPFKKRDITIDIDLNLGKAEAQIFTSDLSHEYVKINVEYN